MHFYLQVMLAHNVTRADSEHLFLGEGIIEDRGIGGWPPRMCEMFK